MLLELYFFFLFLLYNILTNVLHTNTYKYATTEIIILMLIIIIIMISNINQIDIYEIIIF